MDVLLFVDIWCQDGGGGKSHRIGRGGLLENSAEVTFIGCYTVLLFVQFTTQWKSLLVVRKDGTDISKNKLKPLKHKINTLLCTCRMASVVHRGSKGSCFYHTDEVILLYLMKDAKDRELTKTEE